MPDSNGQPDNIADAITEVSERVTALVQDEIELAKAEITAKAQKLLRGAAAGAAGAVVGVFAFVFFLVTLALVLSDLLVSGVGAIWVGFLIVLGILVAVMVAAFLFARRMLKVGPPTPAMALDEARKSVDEAKKAIEEPVTAEAIAEHSGTEHSRTER